MMKVWDDTDPALDGEGSVKSLTVILDTPGCPWYDAGGCLMCGYSGGLDGREAPPVREQFDAAMRRFSGHAYIKVYNSSSFFHEGSISRDDQRYILERIKGVGALPIVETEPTFLDQGTRELLESIGGGVMVALGVESSSDDVLTRSVRKRARASDLKAAADILHSLGCTVKSYVLFRPPFLNEAEAMEDAVSSIADVAPRSEWISVNPVNIQARTPLKELERSGLYSTGWLWSLLEVMEKGLDVLNGTDVILSSSPVGGGSPRGVHNCGKCDGGVLERIRAFPSRKEGTAPDCPCKGLWSDTIRSQGYNGPHDRIRGP